MKQRVWRSVAAAALALAAASCASNGAKPSDYRGLPFGPLGTPINTGGLCLPAKKSVAFDGTNTVDNLGRDDVTIDHVRLVNAHHLRILGAFLLPIVHRTLFGGVSPVGSPLWRQRVKAEGATVRPGQSLNIVVMLTIGTAASGDAKETEIDYHDSKGRHYQDPSRTTLQVVAASACPH